MNDYGDAFVQTALSESTLLAFMTKLLGYEGHFARKTSKVGDYFVIEIDNILVSILGQSHEITTKGGRKWEFLRENYLMLLS